MKKRVFAGLMITFFVISMSASAAQLVTMSGKLTNNSHAQWITAMTVKSGADISNLSFEDVGFVTQERINPDGSYSITIPSSQLGGDMELLSNLSFGKYIYVSQSEGTSDGSGEKDSPVNTLPAALSLADNGDTVVLKDTISVAKNMSWATTADVTVTGMNPDTNEIEGGLDLTNTISLRITAPAKLENMTLTTRSTASISENANKIFACGNNLVLGEGLTMTNPIDAFGGNTINNTSESTNLTIKSGTYRRIYGGGENSPVTGDTKVVIDGSINSQYSAEDNSSKFYDSRIFGGGRYSNSDVGGNTNIIFKNGVIAYIVGGGTSSSVSGNTNIYISGGRVMNVYGGTADKTTVHNGNTNITMTGGMVEAIFGGSMSIGLNGNTNINVTGGEILRRIYGGCYNNWTGSWGSDYVVNGSTTVVLGKNAQLVTGNDLSSGNKDNSGLFAASRVKSNHSEEISKIIFVGGAYEAHGSKLGDTSGWGSIFKSNHDYLVKAAEGGTVQSAGADSIKLIPDTGKCAVIGSTRYLLSEYTLEKSETEIDFRDGYTILNADVSGVESGAVSANLAVGNKSSVEADDYIIAAVYSSDNMLCGASEVKITDSGDYAFELGRLEAGGKYIVKIFVWNTQRLEPLLAPYIVYVG